MRSVWIVAAAMTTVVFVVECVFQRAAINLVSSTCGQNLLRSAESEREQMLCMAGRDIVHGDEARMSNLAGIIQGVPLALFVWPSAAASAGR